MTESAPPMPFGGQTRICKSVLAYNTVDLKGHSVWALTGIQGLFSGSPVVAPAHVYEIIARDLPVGQRISPEDVAAHADLLGARTAIMTQVLTETAGDSAAYWPIAADMLETFLDMDRGVALIGEGAGFVRLLLAARNPETLVDFAYLAMTGKERVSP